MKTLSRMNLEEDFLQPGYIQFHPDKCQVERGFTLLGKFVLIFIIRT